MNKGFSIIETLVVIVVFAIISVVMTQALVNSIITSRKSESIIKVRESLDYTISVMERRLRNSKEITNCQATRIDYTTENDQAAYFVCLNVGSNNGRVENEEGRLTNDEIRITACSISCQNAAEGVPESVDVSLSAEGISSIAEERSPITSSTTINLRVY